MYIHPIDAAPYLLLAIIVILTLREIFTWYWKINKRVNTLDRIDKNLSLILKILESKNPDAVKKSSEDSNHESADDKWS